MRNNNSCKNLFYVTCLAFMFSMVAVSSYGSAAKPPTKSAVEFCHCEPSVFPGFFCDDGSVPLLKSCAPAADGRPLYCHTCPEKLTAQQPPKRG